MLGAAVASARLHLSPALVPLQRELRERIETVNRLAIDRALPLVAPEAAVPIRFIGLGPQDAAIAVARGLMDRGFMAGCALFPAVPGDQAGIRFTVTRHQTLEDLEDLIEAIGELLPSVLDRTGIARDELDRRFGLKSHALTPA
jgi:7-keto-8-aminopelargonate synthetase-like enzyme